MHHVYLFLNCFELVVQVLVQEAHLSTEERQRHLPFNLSCMFD